MGDDDTDGYIVLACRVFAGALVASPLDAAMAAKAKWEVAYRRISVQNVWVEVVVFQLPGFAIEGSVV